MPATAPTTSRPSTLQFLAGDTIRYHIRNGRHDVMLYDWQEYMNFAYKQLSSKYSSN